MLNAPTTLDVILNAAALETELAATLETTDGLEQRLDAAFASCATMQEYTDWLVQALARAEEARMACMLTFADQPGTPSDEDAYFEEPKRQDVQFV